MVTRINGPLALEDHGSYDQFDIMITTEENYIWKYHSRNFFAHFHETTRTIWAWNKFPNKARIMTGALSIVI